jgi:hypothetical protein
MLGTPESEQLKVTALNLFYPTALPSFKMSLFSYCDTASKGMGERNIILFNKFILVILK